MNSLTRAAFYDNARYTRWRGALYDSEASYLMGFNTGLPSVRRTDHGIRIRDFLCDFVCAGIHALTNLQLNVLIPAIEGYAINIRQ
jgi:hypothetical protein